MYFDNIDEMREFLVDECEYTQEKVDKMNAEELLDGLQVVCFSWKAKRLHRIHFYDNKMKKEEAK